MLSLHVISGPHQGVSLQVPGPGTILIGRDNTAHLRIEQDPYFSRHHALIDMVAGKCLLQDLQSRNGTLVNGRKVATYPLQSGDEISVGETRILVAITTDEELPLDDRTGKGLGGETLALEEPTLPANEVLAVTTPLVTLPWAGRLGTPPWWNRWWRSQPIPRPRMPP